MADPLTPFRLGVWRRLPVLLVAVVVALLVAHVWALVWVRTGGQDPWDLHPFVTIFNADDEPSLPSWYSAATLLLASALLLATARARKSVGDRDSVYWHALAIGFCLLSFDEVATLHEAFDTSAIVDGHILGAAAAAVAGVCFTPFLRRLPPPTRYSFLAAAAVFLGGLLGVGYLRGPGGFDVEFESLGYAYATALEAGMKMFAVVFFIRALLDHMRSEMPARAGANVDVVP